MKGNQIRVVYLIPRARCQVVAIPKQNIDREHWQIFPQYLKHRDGRALLCGEGRKANIEGSRFALNVTILSLIHFKICMIELIQHYTLRC